MSVQRCPRCKGEGSVTVTYDDYGMADPKDVMCPVCGGNRFVSPATREAQRSGSVPTSTDGEHQALIEVRQQLQQVEQEREALKECERAIVESAQSWARRAESAEAKLIDLKATVEAREADLHDLICELWAVTDPEGHESLAARVQEVLGAERGSCGNAVCAARSDKDTEVASLKATVGALLDALKQAKDAILTAESSLQRESAETKSKQS